MKLLKCTLCSGEVDIIGGEHSIIKKTKCLKCGFTSGNENKGPEVVIIRKRPVIGE
jgi:hypothetical protein